VRRGGAGPGTWTDSVLPPGLDDLLRPRAASQNAVIVEVSVARCPPEGVMSGRCPSGFEAEGSV
jgi:hypothetical protein